MKKKGQVPILAIILIILLVIIAAVVIYFLINNGSLTSNVILSGKCDNNNDCGISGYSDGTFCSNNDVYQNYVTFVCNNPGKSSSSCSSFVSSQLKESCSDSCSNGRCAGSISECRYDRDCGVGRYTGNTFCRNGDVYQNFIIYNCNNPGSSGSSCSSSTRSQLKESCSNSCSNGRCTNNNCIPRCSGRGCGNDGCGGNCGICPSGQTCNSLGRCIGSGNCNSNSDCNSNQFCDGQCNSNQGTCLNKPQICTQIFQPVCGCNGNTYSNDCFRTMAGVRKLSSGECNNNCIPQCAGRECGNDGCGGNCGICPSGQGCTNGQCANPTHQTYRVSIVDYSFNPSNVQINFGDTVIWTNNGQIMHTVTSNSGNELNSGTLSPGNSYSHTFMNSGNFNYYCTVHPSMQGSIRVN